MRSNSSMLKLNKTYLRENVEVEQFKPSLELPNRKRKRESILNKKFPPIGLEGVTVNCSGLTVPPFEITAPFQRARLLYQIASEQRDSHWPMLQLLREKFLKINAPLLLSVTGESSEWLEQVFSKHESTSYELEVISRCVMAEISRIIYVSETTVLSSYDPYKTAKDKEIDYQLLVLHQQNSVVSLTLSWSATQRAYFCNVVSLVFRDLLSKMFATSSFTTQKLSENELSHQLFHFLGFAIASSKAVIFKRSRACESNRGLWREMLELVFSMSEIGCMPVSIGYESDTDDPEDVFVTTQENPKDSVLERSSDNIPVGEETITDLILEFQQIQRSGNTEYMNNNTDKFECCSNFQNYDEDKYECNRHHTNSQRNKLANSNQCDHNQPAIMFSEEVEPLTFSLLNLGGLTRPAMHTHTFGSSALTIIHDQLSQNLCANSIKDAYEMLLSNENLNNEWIKLARAVPDISPEAKMAVKKMILTKLLHARAKVYVDELRDQTRTRSTTQAAKQGTRQTLKAYRMIKENRSGEIEGKSEN
jgi:hypothetical protein